MREDDTAVPHSINLELLAKLSTGSTSPDEVTRFIVPHLLETCLSCRALYDRLQEIKGGLESSDTSSSRLSKPAYTRLQKRHLVLNGTIEIN